MSGRRLLLAVGAIALGAGACTGDRTRGADSAAADSTVTASDSGEPAATIPASPSPAMDTATPAKSGASASRSSSTRPAPTSPRPATPKADSNVAATTPQPQVADTTIVLGKGRPALVVFRDSIGQADIAWLESEGLAIVAVNKPGHSASVRVPSEYAGNPRANPRVARFVIAMR